MAELSPRNMPERDFQIALSRLIKKIGYSAIRATGELPAFTPNLRHAPVLPFRATYSPWLTDEAFLAAYQCVRTHTLVDCFRCYELWALVQQAAKLQQGALLEVGVWRGGTGCLIAKCAREFQIREPVYLCDTFSGVVKAGPMDTRYRGGEHADTSFELVQALAENLQLDNVRILKGVFPEETAARIAERSLRFVHVDVDVYDSTRDILEYVWPRLVPGGSVVFDDYGTHGCEGVTRIVNEMAAENDRLFIHNLNGHGILIKQIAVPESRTALSANPVPVHASFSSVLEAATRFQ